MKRLMMSVVVVSLLLLCSVYDAEAATFTDYFKRIDHPTWDIDYSTQSALGDGQSLESILTEAQDLGINLDTYWAEFVTGARDAGMTGLDIWNVLIAFVSPETDISSVSPSSP